MDVAYAGKIDTIKDFEWGTDVSVENKAAGYTHGFIVSFGSEKDRDDYLPHPAHKEFGDVLRPHMKDVFVIDYWGDAEMAEVESPLRHAVFFRFKEDAAAEDIADHLVATYMGLQVLAKAGAPVARLRRVATQVRALFEPC